MTLQRCEHWQLQGRIVKRRHAPVQEPTGDRPSVVRMDTTCSARSSRSAVLAGRIWVRRKGLSSAAYSLRPPLFKGQGASRRLVMIMRPVRIGRCQSRVGTKLPVELPLQEGRRKFGRKRALERSRQIHRASGAKDARAQCRIKRLESVDRHAAGEARRDDGSIRRAAYQVEIVAKQGVFPRSLLTKASMNLRNWSESSPRMPPPSMARIRLGPFAGSRWSFFERPTLHPPKKAFPVPCRPT